MAAQFRCDLTGGTSPLPHFWEHTIGSGHATLALRADWQAQMRRAHDELGFRHVRFHGLLCDDMGTLIGEGETLFYSFFNADQIFDFLLSIGNSGLGLRALAEVVHPYPTQTSAIKMAADAYSRTRLTPVFKALAKRWLEW